MQFYIPFGDWSRDGHGQDEEILVEAEKQIKKEYGEDFFSRLCSRL